VSSRTARAIERNPVSKNQKEKEKKKKKKAISQLWHLTACIAMTGAHADTSQVISYMREKSWASLSYEDLT
jgi:hypothetical protein